MTPTDKQPFAESGSRHNPILAAIGVVGVLGGLYLVLHQALKDNNEHPALGARCLEATPGSDHAFYSDDNGKPGTLLARRVWVCIKDHTP